MLTSILIATVLQNFSLGIIFLKFQFGHYSMVIFLHQCKIRVGLFSFSPWVPEGQGQHAWDSSPSVQFLAQIASHRWSFTICQMPDSVQALMIQKQIRHDPCTKKSMMVQAVERQVTQQPWSIETNDTSYLWSCTMWNRAQEKGI